MGRASCHCLVISEAEGVSKVLICYPQYEDERQRNSNTRECSHGSSSTSLLLLSRHGYCAPWHDAARQATVSLSAVSRRARAHISPGGCFTDVDFVCNDPGFRPCI